MTQSTLASDLSPSRAQPGPIPQCFSPDVSHIAHHAASCNLVPLHASMCLHALTHKHMAPEGPCMLPAYVP